MNPGNDRVLRLIIVVFIVMSGMLICDNTMRYQDARDYTAIANNLISGHGFSLDGIGPTAMRPPGYVFFLALLMLLGANVYILKLMNFVALAFSFWIMNQILDRETEFSGTALRLIALFCYPVLFYTAGTLYPQTIAGTLFLTILYRSYYLNLSLKANIITGIVWAILIFFVPSFAAAFILMHLVSFLRKRDTLSALVTHLIIIALFLAPWMIRNHSIFGTYRFSTNVGLNFIYGNSEYTGPNTGINVNIKKYQEPVKGMSEAEIDDHLFLEGINHIKENPGQALLMFIGKTVNYFNYKNEMATVRESSALRDNVMMVSYYLLLLILLVRILAYEQYPFTDIERLIYLLYFSNAFISAIFFTRIRLRIPFDLLLLIAAVLFIERIVKDKLNAKEEEADDHY
jgi:hypothetical protein